VERAPRRHAKTPGRRGPAGRQPAYLGTYRAGCDAPNGARHARAGGDCAGGDRAGY